MIGGVIEAEPGGSRGKREAEESARSGNKLKDGWGVKVHPEIVGDSLAFFFFVNMAPP